MSDQNLKFPKGRAGIVSEPEHEEPPTIPSPEEDAPSPQDEHRAELIKLIHKNSDHIKRLFDLDPGPDPSLLRNPANVGGGYDHAQLADTNLAAPPPPANTDPSQLLAPNGDQGVFSAFHQMNPLLPEPTPPQADAAPAESGWHPPMSLGGSNDAPSHVASLMNHVKNGGLTPFHPQEFNMDVGHNELGSVQNLVNAQNAAGQGRLINHLLRSAELLGSGIAHNEPVGQKIYDDQAKEADGIVTNYKDQVAQEKEDPNSSISSLFRQYGKKLGVNIQGDFTAAEGEKLFPWMFKDFEATQSNAFKDQELKYKTQELGEQRRFHDATLGDARAAAADAKNSKAETDNYNRANIKWNALEQSGRGSVGTDSKKIAAADSLDAFAARFQDLNQVNPQMVAEFTSAFNNLTTGGQASDVKFKKILPPGLMMKGADVIQWFSNKATPAQQGDFLQKMLDSAHDQRDMSQSRIKEGAIKFMDSQSHVNPADVQKFYDVRGVTPEDVQTVKSNKRLYGKGKIDPADLGGPTAPNSGGDNAADLSSPKGQQLVSQFIKLNPGASPEEAADALRSKRYIK